MGKLVDRFGVRPSGSDGFTLTEGVGAPEKQRDSKSPHSIFGAYR